MSNFDYKNIKPVLICSQANKLIVDRLVLGSQRAFQKDNINLDNHTDIFWVDGALEIAALLQKAAQSQKFNLYIVLGAIIKGQSDHYTHVANQAYSGVHNIALKYNLALGNGILTVQSLELALARVDGPMGNVGYHATKAALNLYENFLKLERSE